MLLVYAGLVSNHEARRKGASDSRQSAQPRAVPSLRGCPKPGGAPSSRQPSPIAAVKGSCHVNARCRQPSRVRATKRQRPGWVEQRRLLPSSVRAGGRRGPRWTLQPPRCFLLGQLLQDPIPECPSPQGRRQRGQCFGTAHADAGRLGSANYQGRIFRTRSGGGSFCTDSLAKPHNCFVQSSIFHQIL